MRGSAIQMLALWAASLAWTATNAPQRAIDTEKSVMVVRVYKAGVFSALGHDHEIAAPIARGVVNPAARQVGEMIARALTQNPLFMSAALPLHILPPMFNRYTGGQHFGTHVDGSIRTVPGTGVCPARWRSGLRARKRAGRSPPRQHAGWCSRGAWQPPRRRENRAGS